LGVQWLFWHFASHQGLVYFGSAVTPDSPTFHTAKRWLSVGKKKIPLRFFEDFYKMN